mgnify:FL=1|tara:strand:+ start:6379 stop:6639 length:261 start_codon:yes stop_codon:yes gene_type:complete
MAYKNPQDMNWFEISDEMFETESPRYKKLLDYCVANADQLEEDDYNDQCVPSYLYWKVMEEVYGWNKRDTTIDFKEEGGDDARLLH